jgi:type IV secretion system protein VirB6
LSWGLGASKRTGYELARGVMDGMRREPISRWDSLRRGTGNLVGRGLAGAHDRIAGSSHGGSLVPRERVMPPRITRR